MLSVATVNDQFAETLFSRFSSYTKLRRAVAYWMRYFRALKAAVWKTKIDPFENLTAIDLKHADLALCRVAQKQTMSEEIASLAATGRIPTSSPLKYLRAKLTSDGVIRLGGVLSNAPFLKMLSIPWSCLRSIHLPNCWPIIITGTCYMPARN